MEFYVLLFFSFYVYYFWGFYVLSFLCLLCLLFLRSTTHKTVTHLHPTTWRSGSCPIAYMTSSRCDACFLVVPILIRDQHRNRVLLSRPIAVLRLALNEIRVHDRARLSDADRSPHSGVRQYS